MSYKFDPELAPIVSQLPESSFEDYAKARIDFEKMIKLVIPEVDTSGLTIENVEIPGYQGAPSVPIRIYQPEAKTEPGPALLQIHGGGFVIGNLETEHALAANHAKALGVTVVSVDYRLAPENPYPAGLEDCYAALCWLHENAKRYLVNPEKIGVFGISAGGGLSAALTLMTRELSGPELCFQCLCTPELDDRLETVSATLFTDTPIWDRSKATTSWRYYLGEKLTPGSSSIPPMAAPARETNLENLPPAYVNTMEFDPLRDEGIEYALKLMQAGVPVELHNYPGTFHGSSMIPVSISRREMADTLTALKKGLGLD